jgi:hypothetical protein
VARAERPAIIVGMRFVGERKACAAIGLAFFAVLFFLNGLLGPGPLMPMFLALAAAYLLAFFGLVAGWFWARWYTLGLAFSGLVTAIMLWWQVGAEPVVMVWGGIHLAVGIALIGRGPASVFDARKDWRERWRMDENAANRLGKAIMRAGASLPYLILAGLAPKQGLGLAGVVALVAAVAGFWALARMRTWGVLALGGAAVAALVSGGSAQVVSLGVPATVVVPAAGLIAAGLLAAAVAPFAGPLARAALGSPRGHR